MVNIESHWRVPVDHPAFAGHFPGQPIVPGVVLLDRAMWLVQKQLREPVGSWQISHVKFLNPCGPTDELQFAFVHAPNGMVSFTVRCGERDIASGRMTPQAA